MSTLQMGLCWKMQMPPTSKAVLMSLADQANDQGLCWPAVSTICIRTCLSERTVRNAIRWLEVNNALTVEEHRGTSSRYTLTPEHFGGPVQELLPGISRTPARDAPPPGISRTPPLQQVHPTPAGDAPKPSMNHQRTIREPKADRGSRLDKSWNPTDDLIEMAIAIGVPAASVVDEADKFRDHWIAKSGKDATKLDWSATWRTWCRNAVKWNYTQKSGGSNGSGNQGPMSAPDRVRAAIAARQGGSVEQVGRTLEHQ